MIYSRTNFIIRQDDENELATEIAKMNHYYRNSYITISAAGAASCTKGFLQDSPAPRNGGDAEDDDVFYFPVDLGVSEQPSSLKLIRHRKRPPQIIDSRAWTLQEGLLSNRLLTFGTHLVTWVCHTESWGYDLRQSEIYNDFHAVCSGIKDIPSGIKDTSDDESARAREEDWQEISAALLASTGLGPYRFYVPSEKEEQFDDNLAGDDLADGDLADDDLADDDLADGQFAWEKADLWGRIVEDYTTRALTNAADKLPAISGIAHALSASPTDSPEQRGRIDFVAGLLVYSLDAQPPRVEGSAQPKITYRPRHPFESGLLAFQLLWNDAHEDEPQLQRRNSQPPFYVAPSWSWASHGGAVKRKLHLGHSPMIRVWSHVIWKQAGLEIYEISAYPKISGAPYGALNGGEIILKGCIFRPDEEKDRILSVAFDDGRQDITPGDCSGLFSLRVFPNLPHFTSKEVPTRHLDGFMHSLESGPHGLVLEPVELRERRKVYRRVGVYYSPEPPMPGQPSDVEEIQGWTELLALI